MGRLEYRGAGSGHSGRRCCWYCCRLCGVVSKSERATTNSTQERLYVYGPFFIPPHFYVLFLELAKTTDRFSKKVFISVGMFPCNIKIQIHVNVNSKHFSVLEYVNSNTVQDFFVYAH